MNDIAALFVDSFTRAPWGWALLATVLVALIKVWPVIALQAQQARERLRQEGRSDLLNCHDRLDRLTEEFHQLELKLLGAIAGFRILDIEVETNLPGSTALGQARAVMSAAFTLSPSTPGTGATQ